MSAPSSGTQLSALVSARLCHDLISPIGAIGNGLELLELSGGPGTAELALITDSLATALAKLRFYRLAFGPADPVARQSFDEARQITDAMFHGRLTVTWTARETSMSRATARLTYLAILCLEKTLPMGGALRISVEADSVGLHVEGCRVVPPGNLWPHVTHGLPIAELRSDNVQFALLRLGLTEDAQTLDIDLTESSATLRLTAPAPVIG